MSRRSCGRSSLRYAGQNYEREVPLPPARFDERRSTRCSTRFHRITRRCTATASPARPIELIHANVTALGRRSRAGCPELPSGELPQPRGVRDVHFATQGWLPTPLYRRDELPAGARLEGPAIVEELDSTTLVPPGIAAGCSPTGSLRSRRAGAGGVAARGVGSTPSR